LNSDSIVTEEQFGFRKGLSVGKALYKFLGDVLYALNDKIHVGEIFCELVKAFNYAKHGILVLKLNFYEIKGKAGQWFKSYLNGRKQRI
jgi:hypothetical protein